MQEQLGFIDEFGNSGLNFENENVSSHFIVTAILIDKEKTTQIENELEKIRKIHFQTGEMRSQKVGKNDRRREIILREISKIEFNIYAFVIDKRKIYSEGLTYRKSFYKFLHGMVESKLYKTFPNLKIMADEIGSKEFMKGFVAYVKKRHIPDLFNYSEFGFIESKSNLLIQLADFISGTIAKTFDQTVLSKSGPLFLKILKNHIIEIAEWPKSFEPYVHRYGEKSESIFDPLIAQQSINMAKIFLEEYEKDNDPIRIDQINCLKFLLFHLTYIDYSDYVSTSELINNINKTRKTNLSQHYFRSPRSF